MTARARNAILGAMVATLPSARGTPAFPVASGDLHTLQVLGAAHAGTCSKIREDGKAV
jgi:hypothetical protein